MREGFKIRCGLLDVTRCTRAFFNARAGASIVELALTVPFFALLVLGTVEMSRVVWASIEVSSAASAGAEYGARSTANASNSSNISTAAQNGAASLTGIQVNSSTTCACSSAPTTFVACTASCSSSAHLLQFVQVITSDAVTPLVRYPGLPSSFNVSGKAVMEIEQ